MIDYQDWEKNFIYLAYPLFSRKDIAIILNKSTKSINSYCKEKQYSRRITGKCSYKYITGTWYGNFKRGAKKRGLEFHVSLEYLNKLLVAQKFRCNLSGIRIHIAKCRNSKKFYKKTTASLDRIDNSKGYVEGNVQFLHKHINYMKWVHSQEYFVKLCQRVSKHANTGK